MARLTSRIAAVLVALASAAAQGAAYVRLPGGDFDSVLPQNAPGRPQRVRIEPFELRATPVTVADFQAFLQTHEAWRRDRVPEVFAGPAYLADWADALHPAPQASPQAPVTGVSWFAARAYCESEGARLPTWLEWESAAAADATRADARDDPQWRQRILTWYERPAARVLQPVGGPPDVHGVRDLHGLIWEWVDDFNALFISGDSRTQGDPDKQKFCGAGAISIVRRDSYAVLMRVALLSSLGGADATGSLGFRCARTLNGDPS
ncbi:formylglycine-generating enzyme family protein [Ralstonia pseudosolanacearum]|uniref:Putative signal peptide protein n=5 Tax=Ralstonia solanacearum species complex TaxID=3116862 RepID=A0A0S4WBU5_RALSL|nr:formylglycine-generating enzyme family protein [Ralstonia pseudosolanacearum]CUV43935.1 putative signal peptide protein [Ralstonia solanacearum]MDO3522105.1 formylglycine-generating enzyme family protein [Ralstonia pseudosolanacearum]MDO3545771.1 formylglycine-generating enzyme family protein [Ralstonia pseudosolanacearum]MDO3551443.1 formylglycine-generating enzyme family protein [Ralstonia pseudosolanacearum]MDO3567442.1 formylglycine-generating enzyme family protein [Ralstonia pseudosola